MFEVCASSVHSCHPLAEKKWLKYRGCGCRPNAGLKKLLKKLACEQASCTSDSFTNLHYLVILHFVKIFSFSRFSPFSRGPGPMVVIWGRGR